MVCRTFVLDLIVARKSGFGNRQIARTFVFYFGVVFFGCKAFGDNPFDLKLFIIVFITFSLVCISFDVIDYIYAKRSKIEVQDD